MRYATVVASAYEDSPRLTPLPSSVIGARRIEQGLGRPEFGWTLESMLADRSWPERLQSTLESLPERPESILLSFHGYVAWVGDREPALLLTGPKPRAIPARRICSLLEVWSERVLLILDVVPVVDAGKSRSAIADALRSALDGLGVGVLIGARIDPELPARDSDTFAGILADNLERMAQSVNGAAVMARDLYREVTEQLAASDQILRIRYFASPQDFLLVPSRPAGVGVSRSATPPAQVLTRAAAEQTTDSAARVASRPPAEPSRGEPAPAAPSAAQHSSSAPPVSRVVDSLSPPSSAPHSEATFDPFAAAAQAYQVLFESSPTASEGGAPAPSPGTPSSPADDAHAAPASHARAQLLLDDDDDQPMWLGTAVSFFGSEKGGSAPWAFGRAPSADSAPAPAAPPPAAPSRADTTTRSASVSVAPVVGVAPVRVVAPAEAAPPATPLSAVEPALADSGEVLSSRVRAEVAEPPVSNPAGTIIIAPGEVVSHPPPSFDFEPPSSSEWVRPRPTEGERAGGGFPPVDGQVEPHAPALARPSGERSEACAPAAEGGEPPPPELLFNEIVIEPGPAAVGESRVEPQRVAPPDTRELEASRAEPAEPSGAQGFGPSPTTGVQELGAQPRWEELSGVERSDAGAFPEPRTPEAPSREATRAEGQSAGAPSGEMRSAEAVVPRAAGEPLGGQAEHAAWRGTDDGSLEPWRVGSSPLPAAPPEPEPLPTPPTPEQIADELAAHDELDAALEHYRGLLSEWAEDQFTDRARLLVKVGDMERRLGQVDSALARYHQAFGLDPLNLSALFWATEILYDRRDFAKVEELLQRRLDLLTNPVARVEVLRAMVDLWFDEHRDLGRARHYLDQILREQPEDQQALESMIQVQHAQGDHEEAIRTEWWLASICSADRARQARLLVDAARAAHRYMGDAAYAVDLGEQALHADPRAYEALELVAGLLVQLEDWEHLARSYETVLELECDDWVALDLCEKLAVLYRDKLNDLEKGARALERATRLDPTNARLRLMLVDLYLQLELRSEAIAQCRIVIRDQPEQTVAYRAAFDVFMKLGGADGAWVAASALEYLGGAESQHSEFTQTHRNEGLLAVRNVLSDEDWDGSLLWPEHDPTLMRLLKLVTDVAIEHRRSVLERDKKLLALDPAMIHDPNTSTTMLSRSMLWVARLLGVPAPALYVYPSIPGELGTGPAREPVVLASRTLGSGFDLRELVFLWARHLSSLRGEHHLLLYYPTVGELAQLVTAAFLAGELTPRRADFFDPAVGALAEALYEGIGEEARTELAAVTAELGLSEAGARMLRWARGLEIVSARVGLLAAGDIAVAGELTRRFPVGSLTTPDDQRRDLLIFNMSDEYAELRRRLGVDVDSQAQ